MELFDHLNVYIYKMCLQIIYHKVKTGFDIN